MSVVDEAVVGDIYNAVREIANSFRTPKTDFDLQPIYHKSDKGTTAHLHPGILAPSSIKQ